MAEKPVRKTAGKAKTADPAKVTIDEATRTMLARAQALDIETVFDRAAKMKPCNIGTQGTCCKNCGMGPCRLPLPKGGLEGEDTRKGLCGASANTIAARNFIRMIAGGAAAHSDHGRCVAEVFMSAARKEGEAYRIKDTIKLLAVAPHFNVATKVEVDGELLDRDTDEIALEVAEKALAEWGKPEGELTYLKRAPDALYNKWKNSGVLPRNIDREVVEIMHRTHIGVDQDYKNLMKQGTRTAIADGWGGSMMATDLQDILFGAPSPLQSEANLGVLKQDHVNIVIHGHEPVLSEMIVAVSQTPEMIEYAQANGAKGIQLSGICCTANEILQRHGVPLCGTFLQQELAIITGACDAMVVDIQCIFQNVANVAKCFHTKLITTHPIAKMEQENVIHIEFDEHYAIEDAKKIVKLAIDNFQNRSADVMIPTQKASQVAGFGVESIEYHLGGTFRGSYYTLNDNIINGRIRGVAGVVGCNNARTKHNEGHIEVVKELIKNDVLVITTGCNGIACAMEGLLTPESAGVYCGPGLAEVCETVGIPPVLHMGSCVDNSRILLAATEMVKAGGLGDDISALPVAGSAPEWMSEKAISIGQYFVASGVYTVFGVTPSQHEINLECTDPLDGADRTVLFNYVTQKVAAEHGYHAAFMPKPFDGYNRNAFHIHLSMQDGERRNAFYDPAAPKHIGKIARQFIAGILKYARETSIIMASTLNSYKAYVIEREAPVVRNWGFSNRSSMVRIPYALSPQSTRLELRSPDPCGNPYLQIAVLIAMGLAGIREELDAGPPISGSTYRKNWKMKVWDRRFLPKCMYEALVEAERSKFLKETLGERIYNNYMALKVNDWEEHRTHVTPREHSKYLSR